MQPRRALGKGLGSLIPDATTEAKPVSVPETTPVTPAEAKGGLLEVPTANISPNRYQPRQFFDEDAIKDLAASIKEQGVIQPLVVSQVGGDRYELIAGERRLRASRLLGLETVPVIIKNVDDEARLALALIENVQREDLNAIEESRAFAELVEEFDYSQEEVASKVGKSRSHVANSLRLLKLPQIIQDDVASGRYSAGHARALLGLTNSHEQLKMREQIIDKIPSVRDVEHLVQVRTGSGSAGGKKTSRTLSPQITMLVGQMVQALGTKVAVKPKRKGGGRITIDYYSNEDLDRIFRHMVR
jgi:ParB family chromosome partitioning protein